jgi:hypothetical protein
MRGHGIAQAARVGVGLSGMHSRLIADAIRPPLVRHTEKKLQREHIFSASR